jgi:hypothetical protein
MQMCEVLNAQVGISIEVVKGSSESLTSLTIVRQLMNSSLVPKQEGGNPWLAPSLAKMEGQGKLAQKSSGMHMAAAFWTRGTVGGIRVERKINRDFDQDFNNYWSREILTSFLSHSAPVHSCPCLYLSDFSPVVPRSPTSFFITPHLLDNWLHSII